MEKSCCGALRAVLSSQEMTRNTHSRQARSPDYLALPIELRWAIFERMNAPRAAPDNTIIKYLALLAKAGKSSRVHAFDILLVCYDRREDEDMVAVLEEVEKRFGKYCTEFIDASNKMGGKSKTPKLTNFDPIDLFAGVA